MWWVGSVVPFSSKTPVFVIETGLEIFLNGRLSRGKKSVLDFLDFRWARVIEQPYFANSTLISKALALAPITTTF